jgi:hypothetical protein
LEEGNHCVVHDSCRYLNSDRNAPLHCLVDSASDSADSSNADCGVDAAVGCVMDTGGASGMDAKIVVDDDLCGVVDAGLVLDVVDLFEMDVDVDSCDVDGLLTADVGNDEELDLKTALIRCQLVVRLTWGCGDH